MRTENQLPPIGAFGIGQNDAGRRAHLWLLDASHPAEDGHPRCLQELAWQAPGELLDGRKIQLKRSLGSSALHREIRPSGSRSHK
jgi:hypothetical protein